MNKAYDKRYFDTWYRQRDLGGKAALARKVALAVALAEYHLGRPIRSVLDVGCGEGAWRAPLLALRPKLHYMGLDSSEYAIARHGARRNLHWLPSAPEIGGIDQSYDMVAANAVDLVVSQLNSNETGANSRSATTVNNALKMWRPQAREKGLRMRVEGARALPARVVGDPTRLNQVLNNLLSNAITFTPRGGRIEVRAMALEAAGELPSRLQLQVRDTGVGIAPEHHANVFEAFTQADASTARPYGGSGLGLAICQEITRSLGGEMALDNRQHHGQVVGLDATVRLPLAAT